MAHVLQKSLVLYFEHLIETRRTLVKQLEETLIEMNASNIWNMFTPTVIKVTRKEIKKIDRRIDVVINLG